MKKFLSKLFLLTLVISTLMTVLPQTVAASKIGDVVDYVLYTDIVAYIDKQPIQSFNINGYTAVVVEDLVHYGFDVTWEASTRSLYASLSTLTEADNKPSYKPDNVGKNMVGKRAASVLYTDIQCFFDGRQINSFNIGGKTIVYVDDLAEIYAGSYIWDADKRTLNLGLITPWNVDIENPKYDWNVTEILNGFTLEFENHSASENTNFIVSDYSGDYAAINSVSAGDGAIGFSIYQDIISVGDFFNNLSDGVNIYYSERIANDTAERREKLSEVFRVYINGELVNGELARSQGNGHVDYRFIFDKHFGLTGVKTIRVELGYKKN